MRNKGTFNFAANFEVLAQAPLDARQIVSTFDELLDASTWEDSDSNIWLYKGIIVAVTDDTSTTLNGVYYLADASYNIRSSWVKVGSQTDVTSLEASVLYNTNVNVSQDASIINIINDISIIDASISNLKSYIDSQDQAFDSSMNTYVDSQDQSFDSSMATYVNALDKAFDSSMATYVGLRDASILDLYDVKKTIPGVTWEVLDSPENNGWIQVTYGNGTFVAISYNGTHRIMYSRDGKNWNTSLVNSSSWRSITYGNGLFVAVSYAGDITTSVDGKDWTYYALKTVGNAQRITYGNGLFVVVSYSLPYVSISYDGINWENKSAPQGTWADITYGNDTFVAIAYDGTYTNRVMSSTDGSTWVTHIPAENNFWQGITYGNGLFVAVSSNGTHRAMKSLDGSTWSVGNLFTDNWYAITYGDGIFVAGSIDGDIITSKDASVWIYREKVSSEYWSSITYGNGMFVAVQNSSTPKIGTSGQTNYNDVANNNVFQGGVTVYGSDIKLPSLSNSTIKDILFYDESTGTVTFGDPSVTTSTDYEYINAQDQAFDSSIVTYVNDQDQAFDSSIVTYVNDQDQAFDSSIVTYVNDQDQSFDSSIVTYVNDQDQAFDSSISTYIGNNYLPLVGGTLTGNLILDASLIYNNISTVDSSLALMLSPDGSIVSSRMLGPLAFDLRQSETVSRTIYVDVSTGSDVTGDGTLLLPYETIGRALDDIKYYIVGVTITIQLGEGTYDFTNDDIINYLDHFCINILYPIKIIGVYEVIETGLNIAVSSNPYIYNVSGASWSVDEYKKYFVGKGTVLYPIHSNSSNTLTISVPNLTGLTEISELKTILNINCGSTMTQLSGNYNGYGGVSPRIYFDKIELNPNSVLNNYGVVVVLNSCLINSASTTRLIELGDAIYYYTYIQGSYSGSNIFYGGIYLTGDGNLYGCIIENTYGNKGSGLYLKGGSSNITNGILISGYSAAFCTGYDIFNMTSTTSYILNCNNLIGDNGVGKLELMIPNAVFYLDTVLYLFNFVVDNYRKISGLEYVDVSTSLISDFNPASAIQEYINVGKNISIEVVNNGFQTNLQDDLFKFKDVSVYDIDTSAFTLSSSDNRLATSVTIKNYIDSEIISSTTTAWNGLTKTDNSIGLGGTVANDTQILCGLGGIKFNTLGGIDSVDIFGYSNVSKITVSGTSGGLEGLITLYTEKVDSSGNLTYIDSDYQGGNYVDVWGDGTFIYTACSIDGLCSYSVDSSGNLTYIDSDDQSGEYLGVWSDGAFIYTVCGEDGLRSYSVDSSGNLTYIDSDDQGGSYISVWGDGTYVYVTCYDCLRSYSVDSSGNLTYIDTNYQMGEHLGVWGDGTYIYVACWENGLRSYSVDSSGNLTYIDSDNQGGSRYYKVWGDGTFIYTACGDSGLRSYSVDSSGNLIYIDTNDQGGEYLRVWGDNNYIYAACDASGLSSYSAKIKNDAIAYFDNQGLRYKDNYSSCWGIDPSRYIPDIGWVKSYTDGSIGNYLPLSGGTITGNLSIDGSLIYINPILTDASRALILDGSTVKYRELGPLAFIRDTSLIYPAISINLVETLPYDTSTYLTVGNTTQNESLYINYQAKRNGYTLPMVGTFWILNDGSNAYTAGDTTAGDDIGLTFLADISTNDIQLICHVNDSSTNNVTFKYNIERKML